MKEGLQIRDWRLRGFNKGFRVDTTNPESLANVPGSIRRFVLEKMAGQAVSVSGNGQHGTLEVILGGNGHSGVENIVHGENGGNGSNEASETAGSNGRGIDGMVDTKSEGSVGVPLSEP